MRPTLLRYARVASEHFPTPASVLAAADPWCLPADAVPASSRVAGRLAAVLTKKDFQTGWHLFSSHRQQFSPDMLRRLLAILPSGAESAHLWWPRALAVKDAITAGHRRPRRGPLAEAVSGKGPGLAGHGPPPLHGPLDASAGESGSAPAVAGSPTGLTTADYAVLINLAAHAGSLGDVEALWAEMRRYQVPRDTNAWNQYIAAVCDAHPQFWPWPRRRSTSFARRVSQGDAPERAGGPVREHGQVLALLDRMEVEGVPRDARTFELVLLALAREGYAANSPGIVATLESLARRLWGRGGGAPPTLSALTAIVNSFALHSRLVDGCRLVQQIVADHPSRGAGLGLQSPAAHPYWSRLLRLVVAQTEPRNNVPSGFFDEVWTEMVTVHRYVPSLGCQSIRVEYLEMKNQFDAMFAAIPEILGLGEPGRVLATSTLQRAVVGMARTGRAMEALKRLQEARALGVEPVQDLDAYLAKNGATLQQLQMFEEDDDEDSIL